MPVRLVRTGASGVGTQNRCGKASTTDAGYWEFTRAPSNLSVVEVFSGPSKIGSYHDPDDRELPSRKDKTTQLGACTAAKKRLQ